MLKKKLKFLKMLILKFNLFFLICNFFIFVSISKSLINPLICQDNNELYYEIRQMPMTKMGEINLLVMCSEEVFGYVVGKVGLIANSLRTLLNIRAQLDQNKVNIKFEVL